MLGLTLLAVSIVATGACAVAAVLSYRSMMRFDAVLSARAFALTFGLLAVCSAGNACFTAPLLMGRA